MANSDSTTKAASASNRVNFTPPRIKTFTCPEGKKDAFLWDEGQPGLGLRAFASGKKTYIFQTWINGRTQRTVIGPVESFDIKQARTEAKKLSALASQGTSPTKAKREKAATELAEEQQIKRGLVTAENLWLDYIAANKENWGEKHYSDHLKAIQEPGKPWARGKDSNTGKPFLTKAGPLYPLMAVKLADLSEKKIQAWLDAENKTRPGSVAQAYRLLFAALNWATEQQAYSGLFDIERLKTKAVKRAVVKLKPKSDCLQREQLPAFFTEVRKIQNPVISAFVQTLLLTGARRNELSSLKWEDVDFTWNSLTLRDKAESKGGQDGLRVIPLTPFVKSLLLCLPRRNQWVFSSPSGKDGKLTDPRKSYGPAIQAAGLDGLTLHGLRRSFITLSEWCEIPAGVIAQIAGHKPTAIQERHYKKRPIDLLRVHHETLERWFINTAGLEMPAAGEQRLTLVEGA